MAFLEVTNIEKSFGSTRVLNGVSFTAEKGEVVSIIGSSGGGKTTLLRAINLLELPDGGRITVNGDTVYDASLAQAEKADSKKKKKKEKGAEESRLHFGLVFQQFNLFPQYTVFENVCLAPRLKAVREHGKKGALAFYPEIEKTAEELLARVGLSEKKDAYPCQLSGGQQQRVAIARALALKPDVLCFDEPTSALDPELTREVLHVICSLKAENMTMIIVTHEMEFARQVSDKVIFIADGQIEEEGSPEEVFGNPKSEKTRLFFSHSTEAY